MVIQDSEFKIERRKVLNEEIKANKTDMIFFKLAQKVSPSIMNYELIKKLIKYAKGNSEMWEYKNIFCLFLSKSIFNFLLSILLAIFFLVLSGPSKGSILLCLTVVILLTALPFAKLKRMYEVNEAELEMGLENLVNELAILVSTGMSLDSSIKIYRRDRSNYYVMDKFYKEIEDADKKGLNINSAILGFGKIYNNKYLNKLNVIISQSSKKGNGKQAEALKNLAVEIMVERRNKVKKKAETISTKMLMPLMVAMIGIIIMIMVPIFMQLQ